MYTFWKENAVKKAWLKHTSCLHGQLPPRELTTLPCTYLFFMLLLLSTDFFQSWLFKKKSFRNTLRVLNSLDPDHFVSPDPGPNCLQGLIISRQQKSPLARKEFSVNICLFVLILYIPINNFSVMLGLVFLGWTSTKQRTKCLSE